MSKRTYFIQVAYKGTAYHGWQKQPNAITVQSEIERVLSVLLNEPVEILGSGRTDAGVHATGQIFQLSLPKSVDPQNVMYRANKMLAADIAFKAIYEVNADAHARFDATSRSYEYKISGIKNPFGPDLVYHFNHELDHEKMNLAAAKLLAYTDFESFSKVKTDVHTFNCDITEAVWKRHDEKDNVDYVFHVSANRFLRGMVRALVGTLLEVGLGRMEVEEFEKIIQAKNRTSAGRAAPAHGLYLTKVEYPEDKFIK